MALKIETGRVKTPVKAVIYGPEGIGKSTLAAALPKPLFLDSEDGTSELDVSRIRIRKHHELMQTLRDLKAEKHGFKTLVIDTADWAEKMLLDDLIEEQQSAKIKSIEDFGYGKGYPMLAAKFMAFLTALDALADQGMHIVVLAHAKVTKVSPPDQTDGYDKWELKLTRNSTPLLKEWAKMVLFCNFGIKLIEGDDKKTKAVGGKERYIYATPSAAYDAKNRYGLADCLVLEPESILHVFEGLPEASKAVEQPAAATVEEPATMQQQHYIAELVTQLLMSVAAQKEAVLWASKKRTDDAAKLTKNEAIILVQKLRDRVAEKANSAPKTAAPATPKTEVAQDEIPMNFPSDLKFLEPHSAKALKYLVEKKWLQPGQNLEHLTADKIGKIVAKKDNFLRAIGVEVK